MLKSILKNGTAGAVLAPRTGPKPFTRSWVKAGDLRPGDEIILADGSTAVVESVKPDREKSTVYNFAVDVDHTYFVGEMGAWVHNVYGAAEAEQLLDVAAIPAEVNGFTLRFGGVDRSKFLADTAEQLAFFYQLVSDPDTPTGLREDSRQDLLRLMSHYELAAPEAGALRASGLFADGLELTIAEAYRAGANDLAADLAVAFDGSEAEVSRLINSFHSSDAGDAFGYYLDQTIMIASLDDLPSTIAFTSPALRRPVVENMGFLQTLALHSVSDTLYGGDFVGSDFWRLNNAVTVAARNGLSQADQAWWEGGIRQATGRTFSLLPMDFAIGASSVALARARSLRLSNNPISSLFARHFGARSPSVFANQFPDHDITMPRQLYDPSRLGRIRDNNLNYVVTQDGRLIVGRRSREPGGGHIDLAGGDPVRAAGEVRIRNGQIVSIDNSSGHYLPSGDNARVSALSAFRANGYDLPDSVYVEKVWDESLGWIARGSR